MKNKILRVEIIRMLMGVTKSKLLTKITISNKNRVFTRIYKARRKKTTLTFLT